MKIQGTGGLVTGGAAGIGKAVAEALLERGGRVCVIDIDGELGKRTVDEFKARYGENSSLFCQCDLSDKDQLESSFRNAKTFLGRLDIVVNNAGLIHDATDAQCERQVAVNMTAVYRGCVLGMELMRKDKGNAGGVVVNTSSIGGLIPFGSLPLYCATKHAVVGMTRSFAIESGSKDKQVRFNCVCPFITNTRLTDPTTLCKENHRNYEGLFDLFSTPRRVLEPAQAAESFVELIENDEHNGTTLFVGAEGNEAVMPPEITKMYE